MSKNRETITEDNYKVYVDKWLSKNKPTVIPDKFDWTKAVDGQTNQVSSFGKDS